MAPRVLLSRPLPEEGASALHAAAASGAIELIEWSDPSCGAERTWMLSHLRAGGVEAVIVMLGDKVDQEFIEAAGPSLRVVSTMSAGYDHIDTGILSRRSIKLGTTPDALSDATADVGAMLVLMASRRAGELSMAKSVIFLGGVAQELITRDPVKPPSVALHAVGSAPPLRTRSSEVYRGDLGIWQDRSTEWGFFPSLNETITPLIVYTNESSALKRLLGFGIGRALYTTSRVGEILPTSKDYFGVVATQNIEIRPAKSLEELAQESDFLVICCALTEETKGLVGESFMRKMKKTSYIVNTARGPILDSDALAKAIDEGRIAGAGLDVLTGEPAITAEHPLVKQEKVVVLPHLGSATYQTRGVMALQSVQNALAALALPGFSWVNEVEL